MYGHKVSSENNVRTTSTSAANWQGRTKASIQNNENTVSGAGQRNQNTIDAARQRNAARIAEQLTAQSDNDLRMLEKENAISKQKGVPLPYPQLDAFKNGLAIAISQVAENPGKLAAMLKSIDKHSSIYGPELLMYARRQLQDAATQGGSNATVPFLPTVQQGAPPPPYPGN